jgi:uncharacterized membrane protein
VTFVTVETYGPADLYVVAFPQERIPQGVRDAVLGTLSSGVITLLDLLVVRRQADGSSEVVEIENLGDELDMSVIQATSTGLIGDEDLDELLAEVQPGTSVLVALFENTWARAIAAAVRDSGAEVISAQRFPADVVNEVAELAGVADAS